MTRRISVKYVTNWDDSFDRIKVVKTNKHKIIIKIEDDDYLNSNKII